MPVLDYEPASYYAIQITTLKKITDAVKQVRNIKVNIPVGLLAEALKSGIVSTTAEMSTDEILIIRRQTLVDIADVIRFFDGTTANIAVPMLESRILNLINYL